MNGEHMLVNMTISRGVSGRS